jgi:hypothetical protein
VRTLPILPHASAPIVGDKEGRVAREWYAKLDDLLVALRSRLPITGTVTFAAATSAAVTLTEAQPDTDYNVHIDAPEERTAWVTAKTTAGFTINVDTSSSAEYGWTLIRL